MAVPITSTMQNAIAQNYIAILGRNPEAGGFAFWLDVYANANGTPEALKSITNGFGNSAEFRGTYGSLSTEAAIGLMYQNVLLRAADAGGLAYWTNYANNLIRNGETISNAYAQTGYQIIFNASTQGNSDAAGVNARTAAAVTAGTTAPTSTYTLTTGIDTFGNAGSATQVFNAADLTFTSLDKLTGGSSTADTLNVAQTLIYNANPAGATVTNVENVNFSLGAGGVITTAAGSGFTGVTNLGVTSTGNLSAVTAAATTAITVTSVSGANALAINGGSSVALTQTGALTGANITVGATTATTGAVTVTNTASTAGGGAIGNTVVITGGSTVNVTSNLTSTATAGAAGGQAVTGAVTVTGTASTTSVSVTQSAGTTAANAVLNVANTSNALAAARGVTNSIVTINDANAGSTSVAGTITTVTLANYGASVISSSALTTLTLSSSAATGATASGTLAVTYGLTTGNPTALALNLGGGSLGVLTLNGTSVATVNVALTAATTLEGITNTALRTLNLTGTGVLSLTNVNTAITAITNTSAAAGLSANVSALTNLTSLNFASTSANNTITLNAVTQTYTGGTGNDVVTISADATKAITGGTGSDTIVLGAVGGFTAANTGANVTGFETVGFNTVSSGTYALNTIGLAANTTAVSLLGTAANSITASGLAAGTTTFNINADQNGLTHTFQYAGTAGAATAVTLNLNAPTATGIGVRNGTIVIQDSNSIGVGTINLVSNASVFQGQHTVAALNNFATSQLSNLNITGTGSVVITAARTAATTLTISDNATGTSATSDGITTLTGGTIGALNYSGTKAFAIGALTNDVANLTITNANTGTSGVLTIGSGTAHVQDAMVSLNLLGSVAYTGTSAVTTAATVNGATNNSAVSMTFTLANAGIKTVTLGNGANTVVTGTAKDVITVGTGANTITAGAEADAVTLGAGHTTVNRLILNAVATTSSDSGQVVVAGAGNDTGQDVYTNVNIGTDVFRVVSTAVGSFNGATNVGIGTGGTGVLGELSAFTTNTGVIYLGGTTGTFGNGGIAVTFTAPSTALTTANFNSMLQYDLTTANAGVNTVVGGSLNDVLRATTQTTTSFDSLAGGTAGADNFVVATRANAINAMAGADTALLMDKVVGFTTGTDKITLGTGAGAFGTGLTFVATGTVGATTVTLQNGAAAFAGAAANITALTALMQASINGLASSSTVVQAYVFATGTMTNTAFSDKIFLVINDDIDAIGATDTIIDITGRAGTTVAADIVFGTGTFIA